MESDISEGDSTVGGGEKDKPALLLIEPPCKDVEAASAAVSSPLSSCFKSLKSAAASRILLNSMQKACTSMNSSWTLIILFRMSDCRNTHNNRTWKLESNCNFCQTMLPERFYPTPFQLARINICGTYQTILHIFIFYCFAGWNTVRNIQVNELCRKLNCSSKPIYNLVEENWHSFSLGFNICKTI